MTTNPPREDRPLSGRRVLVADGPESSRARLADLFRRAGAAVHAVGSGRAARIAWAEPPGGGAYDVAVLGFAFPDSDGPTVAEALRSAGLRPPVVGLTAGGSAADADRWRPAGCDLVLSCSTDGGALLAAVDDLVGPGRSWGAGGLA